jgi:hypothetical protein
LSFSPVTVNALPLNWIGSVTVTAAFTLTVGRARRMKPATVRSASTVPPAPSRRPVDSTRNIVWLNRVTRSTYSTLLPAGPSWTVPPKMALVGPNPISL